MTLLNTRFIWIGKAGSIVIEAYSISEAVGLAILRNVGHLTMGGPKLMLPAQQHERAYIVAFESPGYELPPLKESRY